MSWTTFGMDLFRTLIIELFSWLHFAPKFTPKWFQTVPTKPIPVPKGSRQATQQTNQRTNERTSEATNAQTN